MGWTPADVRAASLADFTAAIDGYLRAQGVDGGIDADDRAELRALLEKY